MQGQTINGYTLKYRLGEGGMAEVWYAENEIGKTAAVKILNENLSRRTQIVERFHNEALVMVKLDHPNIRQVYGYGYLGDRHCIIMEYLDGDDLDALLRSGMHFTDEELRRWWNQTVDALNYTHAMGIVHRDIKPSNIFLDKKGNIKLLDFGIAKVKESMSMTRTGMTMGTLMYMSPEQVKDPKRVDAKSDVYSLAVAFVHLLTGKPIYDSDTNSEFDIQMSIVSQPVDLSSVPSAWQGFLAPYLEKDPDKRPALRHFEKVDYQPQTAAPTMEANTIVSNTSSSQTYQSGASSAANTYNGNTALSPTPENTTKSKKGLWIALGAVAAAALMLILLKPVLFPDPDTEAFEACYSIYDYRSYIATYGSNARHYAEAKQFVDNYVADSTAQALEAERIRKEEEERQRKLLLNTVKDEYIRLLNNSSITGSDYDEYYFLYDIDNDGIAEIWIKNGTCEADYTLHVYTYKDGIRKIGELGAGHCSFSKGNGYVLRSGGQMGYYFLDKLTYDGSSISENRVYEEEYDFEREVSVPIMGDRMCAEGTTSFDYYSLSNKQPILNTFYTD